MELDDLKKTWNLMDEQLKDKKLVKDEDISRLILQAGSSINNLGRFVTRTILISICLIGLVVSALWFDRHINWLLITLMIAAVPALVWDLFTTYYLRKTRLDEMPLVKVIARINQYYRWMIGEAIIGVVFILTVAIVYFIDQEFWVFAPPMILLFFALWGGLLGFMYWIFQKKIMKQLKQIRKNLKEVKEMKEDGLLD